MIVGPDGTLQVSKLDTCLEGIMPGMKAGSIQYSLSTKLIGGGGLGDGKLAFSSNDKAALYIPDSKHKDSTFVTRYDLGTLKDGEWVSGEVLDFYFRHLIYEQYSRLGNNCSLHSLTSLCSQLVTTGNVATAVSFFQSANDLKENCLIFLPLHVNQSHWILGCITKREGCVEKYIIDSKYHIYKEIEKYIDAFCLELFPNLNTQKSVSYLKGLYQYDSFNCGLYVLANSRKMIETTLLDNQYEFSYEDISNLRKEIFEMISLRFSKEYLLETNFQREVNSDDSQNQELIKSNSDDTDSITANCPMEVNSDDSPPLENKIEQLSLTLTCPQNVDVVMNMSTSDDSDFIVSHSDTDKTKNENIACQIAINKQIDFKNNFVSQDKDFSYLKNDKPKLNEKYPFLKKIGCCGQSIQDTIKKIKETDIPYEEFSNGVFLELVSFGQDLLPQQLILKKMFFSANGQRTECNIGAMICHKICHKNYISQLKKDIEKGKKSIMSINCRVKELKPAGRFYHLFFSKKKNA